MPFEPGNKHAAKRREFEQAIRRSLSADDYQSLRDIADKVRDLAKGGERWAVELLRDTLDGKPAQQIVATDTEGRSLAIGLVAYAAELRSDDPVSIQPKALPTPDIEGTGQRH
jgi:hypothetical protein